MSFYTVKEAFDEWWENEGQYLKIDVNEASFQAGWNAKVIDVGEIKWADSEAGKSSG